MTDELLIKIKAETDKATAEIKKLTGQVDKLTKSGKKVGGSAKGVNVLNKSFTSLGKTLTGLVAAYGAIEIAQTAIDWTKQAAKAEQAADAFERVFEDMGLVAEEEFNKIKESAMGMIPEAAIKQSAVTAASLGVPINKLAGLMEVARAKAREMGTDVKSAFNDLAIGIGRGSPMILDNLGLTIKLEEAYKKWAAANNTTTKAMSKSQKQLALTNAVLEAGAESVLRYADASLSAQEQMQVLNTEVSDLKVRIGKELLPILEEATKKTIVFLQSMKDPSINAFGGKIDLLKDSFHNLYLMLEKLVDIGVPDILKGDYGIRPNDTGTFFGDEEVEVLKVFEVLLIAIDNVTGASEKLTTQLNSSGGLSTAFSSLKKESPEVEILAVKDAILETIKANQDQINQWKDRAPEQYAEKILKLEEANNKLFKIYQELLESEPYKKVAESAKKAYEETKKLSETTKKLSEEEIKALDKLNKTRLKNHEKTLKSLLKNEEKLKNDIIKINENLVKELAALDQDRFESNLDIEQKIRDIGYQSLTETEAYYQKQKDAAIALSEAKKALYAGEFEKYKEYISQYESLATESAGKRIEVEGAVLVSQEETSQAGIAALKNISGLENEYYDKKKQMAIDAAELAKAQKEAELEGIKAQLIGTKELIEAFKILAELITGKKIEMDFTAITGAIQNIEALQGKLKTINEAQTKVKADSADIDIAKQKVQELQLLTINGVTLEVDANTTPADFGIDNMITKVEGDKITMEFNPKFAEAEKEIEDFKKGEEKDPLDVKLKPKTKELEKEVKEAKKPIDTEVTLEPKAENLHKEQTEAKKPIETTVNFKPETNQVDAARDRISQPIFVPVTYVPTNSHPSGGGYASGGYTGAGLNSDVAGVVHKNEFVFPASVVSKIGVGKLYEMMNSFKLPKLPLTGYANGGLVGASSPQMQPINLNIGGKSFQVMSDRQVANALTRFIEIEGGL